MPRRNAFDEQPTDVAAPLALRYEPETRSYHDDSPKRPPRGEDEPAERPGVTRA